MDRGPESEVNTLSASGFPEEPGSRTGKGRENPSFPGPLVSPQRSKAAVGLGEAAKMQLRRERVRAMDVHSAPRAKARTAPEIRGKEARARALPPGPWPTHSAQDTHPLSCNRTPQRLSDLTAPHVRDEETEKPCGGGGGQ